MHNLLSAVFEILWAIPEATWFLYKYNWVVVKLNPAYVKVIIILNCLELIAMHYEIGSHKCSKR